MLECRITSKRYRRAPQARVPPAGVVEELLRATPAGKARQRRSGNAMLSAVGLAGGPANALVIGQPAQRIRSPGERQRTP